MTAPASESTPVLAQPPSALGALGVFPVEVNDEILSYLLVDTPRGAHRTAVLAASRALREIGLPLLHRVVDLTDFRDTDQLLRAWHTLFGYRGTLTEEGSRPKLREEVRELRIGGPMSSVPQLHGFGECLLLILPTLTAEFAPSG